MEWSRGPANEKQPGIRRFLVSLPSDVDTNAAGVHCRTISILKETLQNIEERGDEYPSGRHLTTTALYHRISCSDADIRGLVACTARTIILGRQFFANETDKRITL